MNKRWVEEAFGWYQPGASMAELRAGYDTMCPPPTTAVVSRTATLGGVTTRIVSPPVSGAGVVLFLHGGGFVMGSSRSHFSMGAELAALSQMNVALIDYRLAPEAPYPAALEDACAAYRGLLDLGYRPENIALAGDSAGGGLALSTLFALRDARTTLPSCVVTMSAWTDMTCSGESISANASVDPLLTADVPRTYASLYRGEGDLRDPLTSPLFGEFAGLPPMLMQVGSDEILLDDTLRVAKAASQAGCNVIVQEAAGMMHVYQMLTWLIPEARAALRSAAQFIDTHVKKTGN